MLKNIITLLHLYPAYNVSERIEIAKGKNAIPKTTSQAWDKIKREFKYKLKDGQ